MMDHNSSLTQSPPTQILSRIFKPNFLLACFFVGALFTNHRFIQHRQNQKQASTQVLGEEFLSLSRRWNAPLIQLLSGHHVSFVTDMLLMRFLGDNRVDRLQEGQRSRLGMDLLLASDLDRRFYELHHAGAVLLSVVRDDRFSAVELLERANRFRVQELPAYSTEFREDFWPNSIQALVALVYVHQFDFGDFDSAKAALDTLRPEDDAPVYFKQLKERYQDPHLIFELGFRVYEKTLSYDREDSVKDRLREKLNLLKLNYFYFQLFQKSPTENRFTGLDPLGNPVQWNTAGIPWSDRISSPPMKFWGRKGSHP